MDVSVVVPVKDRVKDLTECLDSLEAAKLRYLADTDAGVEITVVDDGSAVAMSSILQSSFPGVNFLRSEETRGPACARNLGLQQARFDTVAFTDSDCVVDPEWIGEVARSMEDSRDAAAVQGPPWLYRNMDDRNARENGLLEQFFWHKKISDGRCTCMDSKNVAFNRSNLRRLYPALNLFPEYVGLSATEDRLAGRALVANNAPIAWNPEMKVYHKNPASLSELIRQKFKHGRGSWYYFGKKFSVCQKLAHHFLEPIKFGVSAPFVLITHGAFWLGYLYERFFEAGRRKN